MNPLLLAAVSFLANFFLFLPLASSLERHAGNVSAPQTPQEGGRVIASGAAFGLSSPPLPADATLPAATAAAAAAAEQQAPEAAKRLPRLRAGPPAAAASFANYVSAAYEDEVIQESSGLLLVGGAQEEEEEEGEAEVKLQLEKEKELQRHAKRRLVRSFMWAAVMVVVFLSFVNVALTKEVNKILSSSSLTDEESKAQQLDGALFEVLEEKPVTLRALCVLGFLLIESFFSLLKKVIGMLYRSGKVAFLNSRVRRKLHRPKKISRFH